MLSKEPVQSITGISRKFTNYACLQNKRTHNFLQKGRKVKTWNNTQGASIGWMGSTDLQKTATSYFQPKLNHAMWVCTSSTVSPSFDDPLKIKLPCIQDDVFDEEAAWIRGENTLALKLIPNIQSRFWWNEAFMALASNRAVGYDDMYCGTIEIP